MSDPGTQHDAELRALREIAATWLEQPELIPGFESPPQARRNLRLWHSPSLRGSPSSLFIYRTNPRRFTPRDMVPICEVTWDRSADGKLVRDRAAGSPAPAAPTVTASQWLVPAEIVERRRAELQTLVFPPFSPSSMGLDGSTSGVEARLGLGTTSIVWWAGGPTALQPLVRWWKETWNELREHAAER